MPRLLLGLLTMNSQTTQTPLFDISHDYINSLKLRTIGIGATVLATAIGIASVSADKEWGKTLLVTSALGMTAMARLAETTRTVQDRINQDVVDISDASRQQVLYEGMANGAYLDNTPSPVLTLMPPVDAVDAVEDIETYDLAQVTDATHLAVVGPSGSGKSAITQYLIDTHFDDANIIALDTDSSPQEWAGVQKVGQGGNIEGITDRMTKDLADLHQRTQRRAEGKPVGIEEVRIVEEFPSLVGDIDEELKKGETNIALSWLKRLLRRGRKYSMKVVLVSQEFEVASLGIKGEGNLRKAFTIIYLGATAHTQLDSVRDKETREHLREYLNTQERPCLVEIAGRYLPADIPDLSDFLDGQADVVADVLPLPLAPDDEYPEDGFEDEAIGYESAAMGRGPVNTVEIGDKSYSELTLDYLANTAYNLLGQGKSKTYIIKEVWNCQGAKYKKANEVWKWLVEQGKI